jgi:plastocyanin
MSRMPIILLTVLAGISSSSLALDASLPTRIVMEDGSPYYVPIAPTIVSNTPILWDNPTPTHHTVTHSGCVEEEGSCLFDSGAVSPGSSFSVPGLLAGRYTYHCRIHPIMRGRLVVTDSASSPSQL